MSKFDDILSLMQEDSVDAQNPSVVPGSNNPKVDSDGTDVATVADLLRYGKGMNTGDTTNKVLGVPLQLITDDLVQLYVKTLDLRAKFKEAAKNPIYRDREEAKQPLNTIDSLISSITANIKSISKEIDNLTLD